MVPHRTTVTPSSRRRRQPERILRVCLVSICVLWNLVALLVTVVFVVVLDRPASSSGWVPIPSSGMITRIQQPHSVQERLEDNKYHHPGKLIQALLQDPVQQQARVVALPTTEAISNSADGKDRVVQILLDAGVTDSFLQQHASELPTWKEIVEQYGDQPIFWAGHHEDACAVFRERVPAVQRMLGAAGMFSTGTNLVTQLLKRNCYIPERVALYGVHASKEQHGMRWQVPWGKHTPAHFRSQHAATHAQEIPKNDILPVITIRHPYRWMRSMCKNPYSARWLHDHQCPNLQQNPNEWNPVTVKYGAATESYQSLAHLWNDWYNDYYTNHNTASSTAYPRIMIRMEDLIFHTQATIRQVCHCAGGRLYSDDDDDDKEANNNTIVKFQYITDSAKADSPGHDTSTGLAEAWIKYSRPLAPMAGMAANDYQAAQQILDVRLMQQFGY